MKQKLRNKIFSLAVAAALLFGTASGMGFSALSANAAAADTYYISSSEGNDANDGLSPETAWKSFANVNAKKLAAGERVLLKRGDTFRERLEILGQGTAQQPIEVSAYGEGEKPCIRLNNGDDDIAVLLKDFYGTSNGGVVASPIRYINISQLKICDTRLGIYVRVYYTENAGKTDPAMQSRNVAVTDCEFENITSGVLPELNAAVDAAESEWDGYSPIASSAIYSVYNDKINELHGAIKGDLPKVEAGRYVETGGGGYEYVFPCAIFVGGKKSTVNDENAAQASSALQYFSVQGVEMRECVAGIMCWFYNWNGQSADKTDKFRSIVQYVRLEDITATGVAPSAVGLEACDGGAVLSGESMSVKEDGWGLIKNVRVVRGTAEKGQNVPLGTTDVIIEKSKNFLIEECEFLGMTNHDNCDGVGFDFEGNDSNIELRNSVFAYNDGGAILIMNNGSGGHSNLFIRNNLMYGNLQNAYTQYNNRNNNVNYCYIEFSNRENTGVIIENNTVRHQRETSPHSGKEGRTVKFIGEAEEGPSTYTLRNNDVACYESGANFKEFSVSFERITNADGKIVLDDAALHSKRYNAAYITVQGKKSFTGTILGKSAGGNSSQNPVAFACNDGYVNFAALEGINWNIPFTQVEMTIDGVGAGKTVSVQFVPDTGVEYRLVAENKVEVCVTGAAGSVFKPDLSANDFRLCNLVTRKKIVEAERLSFTRAVLTLDGNLTATEREYLSLRFADILPSAWEANVQNSFAAIDVDGTLNVKSPFYVQSIELIGKPQTEYTAGEAFSLSGVRAKATYADGTQEEVPSSALTIGGFDSAAAGACTVAIRYKNAVAYVRVNVAAAKEEPKKGGCAGNGGTVACAAAALLAAGIVCAVQFGKRGSKV